MSRFKLAGVALLASTLLLAGCSDQLNDKLSSVASGAENTVNQVGELIQNTGADWTEGMRNSEFTQQITKAQPLINTTTLIINHPVGNITIEPSSTRGEIKVEAKISGSEKDKIKKMFKQTEVSLVSDQGTLTILIHPQGKKNVDLWDWAKKQHKISKLLVDYTIYVPEQVNAYQIHSNVGSITMNKPQGSLKLQTDVGNIQVQEAKIAGESSIVVNTGELDMSIDKQSKFSSLKAKVELGNIVAQIPSALPSEVEATTELGSLIGIDREGIKLNGGGPRITLGTSVGSITVSQ